MSTLTFRDSLWSFLMAIVTVACFLAIGVWMADASPLSYEFTGTLGSGTVTGTFQYESTQFQTNQNGWSNTVYTPTAWNFVVVNNWAPLPGTTFTSQAGSAQWCTGSCMFASPEMKLLTLRNDLGLRLSIAFTPTEQFWQGDYRVEATRTPQSSLVSGTLIDPPVSTTSVPEPATEWLLLVAYGACLFWARWRKVGRA